MEPHDIEKNDEEYSKDMKRREKFDDMEGSDEDDTEEGDEEYDKDMEPDKGDMEDQEYDAYLNKIEQFELMADQAPPLVHKVDMPQTQRKEAVTQTQHKQILKRTQQNQVVKQTTKRPTKGRGPNKGLKVTEPMYLEYNDKGQPCGKWKSKYATHLGHCLRKISIFLEWDEVPEGLLKTLWEDTVNLFHIEPTESNKQVFESGLSTRFRDFKYKLVSGWISLTRDRTKPKKSNLQDEPRKAPDRTPNQIWPHISLQDWNAFVAKNTTPDRVEMRAKNLANAKKRKLYHHMGPKTFDDKRPSWVSDGIYPIVSSTTSVGTSTSVGSLISDRTLDFCCSQYVKDASRNWVIPDPKVKTIVESLMDWKKKEGTGEFTPSGNKDSMFMVLGKDHVGRVRGKGGVRVGSKKAFGEQFMETRGRPPSNTPLDIEAFKAKIEADVEEKMTAKLNSMLEPFGISMSLKDNVATPNDKSSHPRTPCELDARTPQPPFPFPNVTEETPCDLLLRKSGCDDLVMVAYGHAQQRKEGEIAHFKTIEQSNWRVSLDAVLSGFEDFALPIPRPEFNLDTLSHARGAFIEWPCAWIRFSSEVLEKYFPNRSKSAIRDKEKLEPKWGGDERRLSSKGSNSKLMETKGATDPLVKPKATPLVDEQVLKSLTNSCYWLHSCVSNLPDDATIEVQLEMTQFHYQDDATTWVSKGDVREFLSRQMLNVSLLHVFMSALNEDLKSRESVAKVGWLCPQEIRASHCMENSPEVKEYIGRAMIASTRTGDNFIIAPYLEDLHWLLLVISPSNNTVYQFDSARPATPRRLIIKSLLNSEMVKLRGRSLGRAMLPTWKYVRVSGFQRL